MNRNLLRKRLSPSGEVDPFSLRKKHCCLIYFAGLLARELKVKGSIILSLFKLRRQRTVSWNLLSPVYDSGDDCNYDPTVNVPSCENK